MNILKPFQRIHNLHSALLKMKELPFERVPGSIQFQYQSLITYRVDLLNNQPDVLSLRLLLTRISSNIATHLCFQQPLSIQVFLRAEFSKLRIAYKKLDIVADDNMVQEVKSVYASSIDSMLTILQQENNWITERRKLD